MAAELSSKAVWQFVSGKGGKVESAELLEHFKSFLNHPKSRENARAQLKELVNKVGLVVQEGGVKSIRLKKKYRGGTEWPEASAGGGGRGRKEDGDAVENGDRPCEAALPCQAPAPLPAQRSGDGALMDAAGLGSPLGLEGGSLDEACAEKWHESHRAAVVERRRTPQDGRVGWAAHLSISPENYSNLTFQEGGRVPAERSRVATPGTESSQGRAEVGERLPAHPHSSQAARSGADPLADPQPGPDGKSPVAGKWTECPESVQLVNVEASGHKSRSKSDRVRSPAQIRTSPDMNPRRSSRKRLQRNQAVNRFSGVCSEENTTHSSESLNTPRSSRKNFRELMMSGSPQLRHSHTPAVAFPNIKPGDPEFGRNDVDSSSLPASKLDNPDSGSVALDPLEHEWMLQASEGKWDSIETLLAADPSLITWKDFVTGFTCIHWAAKHGKPELLAMLFNYARKHDISININMRSSGGYTPLHLAAMHGHTEVVKLLSGAYDADIDLRDYSGKKAWQYLGQDISEELKTLIGASGNSENALQNGIGRWRLSKVLPANLTYKLTSGAEEEVYFGMPAKVVNRKTSMNMKLNKIRFKTQIIQSSPSLGGQADQRDPKSALKLRPKSTIFG
ncbi:ankyrin repeat domain-containing protein SOWAHC-like [Narcine bancroftii]|uniref:ankyrin repeat domain-containing protein SOWAHC-like n=1 Tax=Narcine bancroftii TaxID=1343680 RepID=UPI0038316D0C